MGSAGKSRTTRSASKAACSGPLLVWKVSGAVPSTVPHWRRACAEARVAWPQRSISVAGENQRSPKVVGASPGTRNAVSAMPSSKAIDCMRASSRGCVEQADARPDYPRRARR